MAANTTKLILVVLLAGVFLVSGCVTPQAEKKITDFGFLGGDNERMRNTSSREKNY